MHTPNIHVTPEGRREYVLLQQDTLAPISDVESWEVWAGQTDITDCLGLISLHSVQSDHSETENLLEVTLDCDALADPGQSRFIGLALLGITKYVCLSERKNMDMLSISTPVRDRNSQTTLTDVGYQLIADEPQNNFWLFPNPGRHHVHRLRSQQAHTKSKTWTTLLTEKEYKTSKAKYEAFSRRNSVRFSYS